MSVLYAENPPSLAGPSVPNLSDVQMLSDHADESGDLLQGLEVPSAGIGPAGILFGAAQPWPRNEDLATSVLAGSKPLPSLCEDAGPKARLAAILFSLGAILALSIVAVSFVFPGYVPLSPSALKTLVVVLAIGHIWLSNRSDSIGEGAPTATVLEPLVSAGQAAESLQDSLRQDAAYGGLRLSNAALDIFQAPEDARAEDVEPSLVQALEALDDVPWCHEADRTEGLQCLLLALRRYGGTQRALQAVVRFVGSAPEKVAVNVADTVESIIRGAGRLGVSLAPSVREEAAKKCLAQVESAAKLFGRNPSFEAVVEIEKLSLAIVTLDDAEQFVPRLFSLLLDLQAKATEFSQVLATVLTQCPERLRARFKYGTSAQERGACQVGPV